MGKLRALLALFAALVVSLGVASPAYADGTFSRNTSQGDYRIIVVSKSDHVKVTVTIIDDNCDDVAPGVLIKGFRTGGTLVNEWKYRQTAGCNSSYTWYHTYTASDLKGYREGYLQFSTFKKRAVIGEYDYSVWTSTHFKIG